MEFTSHYAYHMLRNGEKLSVDDYAFSWQDRANMDHKDYLGAEAHVHTGAGPAVTTPDTVLGLSMEDGGFLPPGTTVRYKYTWVDQYGAETGASPEATVTTPMPISTPDRPTVTMSNLGGSLMPGNYFYVLSAYVTDINHETAAGGRAYATSLSGSTSSVTITFPTLPSGATGWNIYKRAPGGTRYLYLDSVDMTVATPPSDYVDTGAVECACNRIAPTSNNTNSSKKVVVTLPGATPSVPDGMTWKLYRTYSAGDYDQSLLHWVVEETSEGSGVVLTYYEDVGLATTGGKYPPTSQVVGSPSKISLVNAGEVDGELPVGKNIIPTEITFTYAGVLEVGSGDFIWVNEYDKAQIISVRCNLGRGYAPASTDVIVNVQKYDAQAATPSWASIFASPGDRPTVSVGAMIGNKVTLGDADTQILLEGDALVVDIDQAGGGATPTDYNLVVTIMLYVYDGSTTVSHTWATS